MRQDWFYAPIPRSFIDGLCLIEKFRTLDVDIL